MKTTLTICAISLLPLWNAQLMAWEPDVVIDPGHCQSWTGTDGWHSQGPNEHVRVLEIALQAKDLLEIIEGSDGYDVYMTRTNSSCLRTSSLNDDLIERARYANGDGYNADGQRLPVGTITDAFVSVHINGSHDEYADYTRTYYYYYTVGYPELFTNSIVSTIHNFPVEVQEYGDFYYQASNGGIECESFLVLMSLDTGIPGCLTEVLFYTNWHGWVGMMDQPFRDWCGLSIFRALNENFSIEDEICRLGDVNLNTIYCEVGDAVVIIQHLVNPKRALICPEIQDDASDVNEDGYPWTVGDLICLLNIINGYDVCPGGEGRDCGRKSYWSSPDTTDTIAVVNTPSYIGQDSILIPVVLTNSVNRIASFETDIFLDDSEIIEFTGATCGPRISDWEYFSHNVISPTRIRLVGFAEYDGNAPLQPPLAPGSDILLYVVADISDEISSDTTVTLDICNTLLSDSTGYDVYCPFEADGEVSILQPRFIRGDANGNMELQMTDFYYIYDWLYVPGSPAPDCMDAADTDDSGTITTSDARYILNYLYVPGKPPPPQPFPNCGPDPTPDTLGCANHPCMHGKAGQVKGSREIRR